MRWFNCTPSCKLNGTSHTSLLPITLSPLFSIYHYCFSRPYLHLVLVILTFNQPTHKASLMLISTAYTTSLIHLKNTQQQPKCHFKHTKIIAHRGHLFIVKEFESLWFVILILCPQASHLGLAYHPLIRNHSLSFGTFLSLLLLFGDYARFLLKITCLFMTDLLVIELEGRKRHLKPMTNLKWQ